MKPRFKIFAPAGLNKYIDTELNDYHQHLLDKEYSVAWRHLERAHVLGQSFAWPHTYVHYKMLQFGIKIKSPKEVIGQIPRLLVGGIKSFVGNVPLGNTGGANVPPLKPLDIEPELKTIFEKYEIDN